MEREKRKIKTTLKNISTDNKKKHRIRIAFKKFKIEFACSKLVVFNENFTSIFVHDFYNFNNL